MKENRRSFRVKDRVIVSYVINDQKTVDFEGASVDISATGIQIKVFKELEPKQIVQLKIEVISDNIPIVLDGVVVWVKKIEELTGDYFLVGIDFISDGNMDLNRIKAYLSGKNSQ